MYREDLDGLMVQEDGYVQHIWLLMEQDSTIFGAFPLSPGKDPVNWWMECFIETLQKAKQKREEKANIT